MPDAVVLLDADWRDSIDESSRRGNARVRGFCVCPDWLDLQLEGFDVDAVRTAIATGAGTAAAGDLARTIRVEQDGAVQRLLPRVVPVSGPFILRWCRAPVPT